MDTVQRGPTAVTPPPHHDPVRVAELDEELAGMLAGLRESRPAAFAVGLAATQLGMADAAALLSYLAAYPAPGPEAADEDLYAWAGATARFHLWLATDGQTAVQIDDGVRLEVVEVPRS